MKTEAIIDRRMSVMKMAMKLNEGKTMDDVLAAYDAMWSRITTGDSIGPASSNAATEQVDRFFAACVEVVGGETEKIQHKDLFRVFNEWCAANGEEVLGMRTFGELVTARVSKIKTNVFYYVGIRLKGVAHA